MDFTVIDNGVDQSKPLIYLWEIKNSSGKIIYCYIGKAQGGANRPLKHYRRNVNNLLNNKPYRRKNPDGFRTVHRQLAEAVYKHHIIFLYFIRNVTPDENIYEVEKYYVNHYSVHHSD